MNKQNSIVCDNYISTDVGDTLKSYSSKFRQLKQTKISNSHKDILPIKLQRAAIILQRFWRNRMIQRRKLYSQLSQEIVFRNNALQFEIESLNNLLQIYTKDCQTRQKQLRAEATQKIEIKHKESGIIIRKLVGLSMLMEKRKICEQDQKVLLEEKDFWITKSRELNGEKQKLRMLLGNELQQEEQQFMRQIKEENLCLLQVSRQRGELEKQMRQKLVETCKMNFSLQDKD